MGENSQVKRGKRKECEEKKERLGMTSEPEQLGILHLAWRSSLLRCRHPESASLFLLLPSQ